ncbi:hypothetical protein pEaSNUABM11_00027 [Erwinia phage pEa_SNUABM_11]|nr:hypothetical protein pEaSNUABM11_00027 [Erwinia phage pEa_SNUABM_11]
MVYRVLSPQSYCMQLGVVGYIDQGELFASAVQDVIKGLAPFSFEVNPNNFTPEALFDSAYDGMIASASSKSPVLWTTQHTALLNEFLLKVYREYRSWKFRSALDESVAADTLYPELEPVANLCREMNHGKQKTADAIIAFTVERFAHDLSHLAYEAFDDTMTMFLKAHQRRIKTMRIKIDASNLDYAMLDMKMLIEVEEGENDS